MEFDNTAELRYAPLTELRAEADADGKTTINGYAAVFDQLSVPLWGFRERIGPGAFDATLTDDVRALWNHNTDFLLGRTTNGTLRLTTDDHGLRIAIDPPDTGLASDFVANIRRGDVDQMSFMFRTLEDTWDEEDGELIRTVEKLKLYEVSPATFAAYPQTSVSARGQIATATLGHIPEIPAQFRAKYGGDGAELARARLALKRRRLDLLSMEN